MNYSQVIREVALKTGFSQKDVKEVIDTMVKVTTDTLVTGDDVKIANLATFKTVEKAGRTGIIQMGARKGEIYKTDPYMGVKVSVAKPLKDAVKNA